MAEVGRGSFGFANEFVLGSHEGDASNALTAF